MTLAPKIDPPDQQSVIDTLQASNATMAAQIVELQAAAAARDAIPVKEYLKLVAAAREAGVDYPNAWKWHNRGELDSYKIKGTCEIMCEKNDLIARRLRTGRHAKASQRTK